ncbi:MAG: SDR family NAD(P)-dependent oxidoreductase [Pseudomonadota bacterium]
MNTSIRASANSANNDVAIIGIGCRYPGGVHGTEAFWSFLKAGGDGVCDVPADRWSLTEHYDPRKDLPGKTYVNRGAFLSDWSPFDFDPGFFGISAREAESMDPQQRIMLEMAFEAVEDAGVSLDTMAASQTGVFLGCFTLDNKITQMSPFNRAVIDTHTATSSTMAILSNRISYVFGLEGPSLTIDTACSSSLVALHYAKRSLAAGDCELALVGGVNIMTRPEYMMIMGAGHYLAADGRSKAFDARADGYGRGEGGGMLLLKPLAAAERDGDRIYAVIAGTGVNQDGRTNGMSVPSGAAQKRLIEKVLAEAEVPARDVTYVEAHGTGTPVGDPIECDAIGSVLGHGRETALPVRSLKSAIGHQEAGAGIAGVIKAALTLKHRTVAPQGNLDALNPKIPFADLGIEIARAPQPLTIPDDGAAHAAVNSFGYGGTNAMALLRAAPDDEDTIEGDIPAQFACVLPLSARDPGALRERAGAVAQTLRANPASVNDVLWTASHRRPHLAHRLVARAADATALADKLARFGAGDSVDGIMTERAVASDTGAASPDPVFVFSGMGPQYAGMGAGLMASEPVFADAARQADAIFRDLSGWSILDEMMKHGDASRMADTTIAQPANVVLQIGLTELLRARGITAAAMVGHSVGEIGSGYAAGILSMKDACTVAYHRSQLQSRMAGRGTMLAVALSEEAAAEKIARLGPDVSVAAVNAPDTLTLAGSEASLKRIAQDLDETGVFNRFLSVEIAYHSSDMDPLEDDLRAALAGLDGAPAAVPLVSTVSGGFVTETDRFDADYWWKNVRQPVRFHDAVKTLLDQGHRHFLEVGPHPVLSQAIRATLNGAGHTGAVIATLSRKLDDETALGDAMARLHATGASFDWARLHPQGRQVTLPAYPYQRQRLWKETTKSRDDRLGVSAPDILGEPVEAPGPTWQASVSTVRMPWLDDHVVDGAVVFPGAGYVSAAFALLAEREGRENRLVLDRIKFRRGFVIGAGTCPEMRVSLDETGTELSVHSRETAMSDVWQRHATVRLSTAAPDAPGPIALAGDHADWIDAPEIYAQLAERGLAYGPAFQRLGAVRVDGDRVLAKVTEVPSDDVLDPCVLDACFHALIAASGDGDDQALYVPVSIRQIRLHRSDVPVRWCNARVRRGSDMLHGDLALLSETGEVLVEVSGLQCQKLQDGASGAPDWANWLYETLWRDADRVATPEILPQRVALIGDAPALSEALSARGDTVKAVASLAERAANETFDLVVVVAHDQPGDDAGLALAHLLLHTAQDAVAANPNPRLAVILPPGAAESPRGAAAIGVVRVLGTEHPELSPIAVDLSAMPDVPASWDCAMPELLGELAEREVRWTPTGREVVRVRRKTFDPRDGLETQTRRIADAPMSLAFDQIGNLESLVWEDAHVPPPGPGEVQLRAEAAAINFKDVLKVLGLLERDAIENTYHGETLGMETAATVVALGQGVTSLAVGDRIVAQPKGGFRSLFNQKLDGFFFKPQIDGLTHAQSASLLVVYVTAHYGLTGPGCLVAGERVLIHGAAGGVGQAAVKVAKMIGAEIYATAGTQAKRDMLLKQGCKAVYDSRTLDFAEAIRRDTGGKAVDVVLNSLAGEAAVASLELLSPHGRFIEIGKRDFQTDRAMRLAPFNSGLSYTALDLDRRMAERPDQYKKMLGDLWAVLETRQVDLDEPMTVPASEIVDGFRLLSQSQNVGKVVVTFDQDAEVPVRAQPKTAAQILRDDATYVVTGGLTGLGLLTGQMLGELGAGHIILCGRRGIDTKGAPEAIAALRAKGYSVEAHALDVTDAAGVDALVADIAASHFPLRGVIHGAGVLDDGLITGQTEDRMSRVMAPKAIGAWNWHMATRDLPLDLFVIYSSVSAIVGNAGQSGYAAANCFADALAHQRHRQGLPALSINWGPVAELGMAAQNPAVVDYFDSLGLYSMAPEAFRRVFEAVLPLKTPQIIVGDLDWAKWASAAPGKAAEPFFEDIRGNLDNSELGELVRALEGLGADARLDMVHAAAKGVVADTLRVAADDIDAETPLAELGLDSLMTVELQTALGAGFGVEVSAMELMKGGGTLALARDVLGKMAIAEPGAEVGVQAAE